MICPALPRIRSRPTEQKVQTILVNDAREDFARTLPTAAHRASVLAKLGQEIDDDLDEFLARQNRDVLKRRHDLGKGGIIKLLNNRLGSVFAEQSDDHRSALRRRNAACISGIAGRRARSRRVTFRRGIHPE